MKRIFGFLLALIMIISIPLFAFAEDKEEFDEKKYNECLSNYDLSCFEELDSDTYSLLQSLGLTDFDYNTIVNFSFRDFFNTLKDSVKGSAETPIKSCLMIFIFIVFSSLFQSFKATLNNDDMSSLYSTASALIIAVVLAMKMKGTISLACTTISVCADFIYAFVPVFCVIVATSGNTITAFSTNSLLLFLAQTLNYISKNVFIPLSNCFLAIGICSGIRSELNLRSFIAVMKRYITSAISVCSATFVTILSIKTAVSARADVFGTSLNAFCNKHCCARHWRSDKRGASFYSNLFVVDTLKRWRCWNYCSCACVSACNNRGCAVETFSFINKCCVRRFRRQFRIIRLKVVLRCNADNECNSYTVDGYNNNFNWNFSCR